MANSTWFVLTVMLLLGAGCAGDDAVRGPSLEAEGGWVRAMPLLADGAGSGSNSAAYMVIKNRGDELDRLVGVESPVAGRVEVHETRMVDDVMRMRLLGELDLPPGDSVKLVPGGIHVMFVGLTRALLEGDSVELTLRFGTSDPLVLNLPVRLMGEG